MAGLEYKGSEKCFINGFIRYLSLFTLNKVKPNIEDFKGLRLDLYRFYLVILPVGIR